MVKIVAMIAERDLQIGDFINTENNGVVQITVLSWKGVGYEGGASTPEHCSYIPLTEEILVKNGFEYAYNEVSKMQNKQLLVANIGGHYIEVRLDKKDVAIWYDSDENESDFYSDVFLPLPYFVHGFQHLLRLMGIEREIEL